LGINVKTETKDRSLAWTSLVLGILALLFCGLFTGIPAVVTGFIARRRVQKHPGQFAGSGLALFGLVAGCVGMVVSGLWHPLLLPPLSVVKKGAFRVNCANNLKQVGTAFRLWAGDYGERFPFNVPVKDGGTLEFSAPGPDGFDSNAWRHFQVLSNELNTPKILVCPSDPANSMAVDFLHLGVTNVSYQLRSGTNVSAATPTQVLARCPIHGTELLCDGSVVESPRKR
jgi:hypothetical protein